MTETDQEMETGGLEPAIEGILFAAGEAVSAKRIAAVLAVSEQEVFDAAKRIADRLRSEHRGIRLVRLENALQLCSAPELSDVIRQALETRKPPRLTQTALEVLAVTAYFQPVTRAYIESLRGADSSYTVGVLQERGLIEPCGTLDAPGRPFPGRRGTSRSSCASRRPSRHCGRPRSRPRRRIRRRMSRAAIDSPFFPW